LFQGVNAEIELKKGERISITTDERFMNSCTSVHIFVDYKNITKVVKPCSKIFIDDGLICLQVEKIGMEIISFIILFLIFILKFTISEENNVVCEIENGGLLGSKKGVNLPGTSVDLPAVSKKDVEDLRFAVAQDV